MPELAEFVVRLARDTSPAGRFRRCRSLLLPNLRRNIPEPRPENERDNAGNDKGVTHVAKLKNNADVEQIKPYLKDAYEHSLTEREKTTSR